MAVNKAEKSWNEELLLMLDDLLNKEAFSTLR